MLRKLLGVLIFFFSLAFSNHANAEHPSPPIERQSKLLSVTTNLIEGPCRLVSTVHRYWKPETNGYAPSCYDTLRVYVDSPEGQQKLFWDSEYGYPENEPESREEFELFSKVKVGRDQFNRLLILYSSQSGYFIGEPKYHLSVWEKDSKWNFKKCYQTSVSVGFPPTYGTRFFSDSKGSTYLVSCVAGEKGFVFWRIGKTEAIREKGSPISIPKEWQTMTNRLISATTNHLSGGYTFIAKAERNYNWNLPSRNVVSDETGNASAETNPVLTAWDSFTWIILNQNGQTIEKGTDLRPYYSTQNLFWPYADTDPDRILDVYRNNEGEIYLANDRFEGFSVWMFRYEWNLLKIKTKLGPSFLKPVSSAKFHPVGTNLFLRINYENGTSDFWKITGLDAEKVKTPFELSKVRE
ncbi:MAG: hypothetical protein ACI4QT_04040 [Kiritimatiellia bacterium]